MERVDLRCWLEWYLLRGGVDTVVVFLTQVIKSVSALIEETIPPPCPPPTNTSSRGEENVQQLSLSMFQSAIAGQFVWRTLHMLVSRHNE